MKTKIANFFMNSAKVLTSPDELFYVKSQSRNYGGIITSIFYALVLALTIGIFAKDVMITSMLMAIGIVGVLLHNVMQTIVTGIFALILGGRGSMLSLFNLISYASAVDLLLILSIALLPYGIMILVPALVLATLWKMIIVIAAVNAEYEIGFGKSFLASYGILLILITVFAGAL